MINGRHAQQVHISWKPPLTGWVELNRDGASIGELWRVLLGLQMVIDQGFKAVELCIDSQAVIMSIKKKVCVSANGWRLVQKIQ